MYIVAYYCNIVFTMRMESTIVNSKHIQILYYCLYCNAWSNRFDRQVEDLTYIDINMDIVYI